jgi:putative membrane protein
MKLNLPLRLVLGTLLFSAALQRAGYADGAPSPQQFASAAAEGNLFEIESAKLAMQRALNNDTKAFASDMIRDHTAAGGTLESAAKSQGVTLSPGLDDEHQKKLDALKVAPADSFDQAYLSTQVTAHEEAFALFQAYAKGGPDGALRNAANSVLPTLKMHNVRVHGLASPK